MPTAPRPSDLLTRYADIVVRVGVAVEPGQAVVVWGLVEHAELARAIAESAYAAGASRVDVLYQDQHVRRSGIVHGAGAALARGGGAEAALLERVYAEGAAFVRLTGNPEPHLMDDLDPAAVVAAQPLADARRAGEIIMSGAVPWCIVAAPNPGWAEAVLGEPDVERLWRLVAGPLRLLDDDPVASWQEHIGTLARRAAAVEALGLDALRYRGPGTELTVGLPAGARWVGGSSSTAAGRSFVPNLPTEEVFTSPDPARADGTVSVTRPLVMPATGVLVEGLRLTFEAGRIVDAQATRGADAVRAQLDTAPGSRRLGEVSLVDRSSRVHQAGVVFHDTLYDENAGAHIAYGRAFPFCLPVDAPEGAFNDAPVHTDVVVGGPGVSITGVRRDGGSVPIIDDDTWVLPL